MWSYDNSDLGTTTSSGRLNAVRLLIGDIDTNSQLLQDEEITFGLAESGDKVYLAAAWCCDVLASKYTTSVDIRLDEELEAKYSQLYDQFSRKARELRETAKRVGAGGGGAGLGIQGGGIYKDVIETNRESLIRQQPSFWKDQFSNGVSDYDTNSS